MGVLTLCLGMTTSNTIWLLSLLRVDSGFSGGGISIIGWEISRYFGFSYLEAGHYFSILFLFMALDLPDILYEEEFISVHGKH
jgi:hypothetical protein